MAAFVEGVAFQARLPEPGGGDCSLSAVEQQAADATPRMAGADVHGLDEVLAPVHEADNLAVVVRDPEVLPIFIDVPVAAK